jgi:Flp pilus assembly protein TadG
MNSILNYLKSHAARIGSADGGGIAPVFGFLAVPILGCIGLAVDIGSAASSRQRLQTTTDMAVMAGMVELVKNNDPTTAVNNFILSRHNKFVEPLTVTVTPNASQGSLSVTASLVQDNIFISLVGKPTTVVSARSAAAAGTGGGPVEVAIAFDTTGSMTGSKLTAAQEAATQLVDQLFKVPGSNVDNANVRVALVPFAQYVNVGLQYRNASWLTNTNDYTESGVWEWDEYPNATYGTPIDHPYDCNNDGIPQTCIWTEWPIITYGDPKHIVYPYSYPVNWNGCVGSQDENNDAKERADAALKVPALRGWGYNCPAPLIRLTNDKTSVKNAVAAMTASGETYIAPGLLWGWRALTPNTNTPFADGAPKGTAKKILILLTDGANTHSANYSSGDHGPTDVAAANAKVLETCRNIKNEDIEVYTILFQETDATIQGVLAQCSSGPPYHYNANTVADLQGAFGAIGTQLAGIRMVD